MTLAVAIAHLWGAAALTAAATIGASIYSNRAAIVRAIRNRKG